MDSIRASEAPDAGSIPAEATNVRFGKVKVKKGHKYRLFLVYRPKKTCIVLKKPYRLIDSPDIFLQ